MKARPAASLTIWRSSQSSRTAVSTAAPRSGMDSTLNTCGNQALDAVRTRSRLGRLHSSFVPRPSHGRAPRQVPSGLISIMLASDRRRVAPHSQRTTRSVRSPVVPCSSSHSGRGRRALVAGTMHEPAPVEIVDVPARASADETRGHHVPALEAALLVERLPMHKTPGPRVQRAFARVRRLHDEPLGKAPCTDAGRRCPGIGRRRRRRPAVAAWRCR